MSNALVVAGLLLLGLAALVLLCIWFRRYNRQAPSRRRRLVRRARK